jgi:hypothetical protein
MNKIAPSESAIRVYMAVFKGGVGHAQIFVQYVVQYKRLGIGVLVGCGIDALVGSQHTISEYGIFSVQGQNIERQRTREP